MRRLVPTLLTVAFAATLHASVPSAASPAKFNPSTATVRLDEGRAMQKLPPTAAPADTISFYMEFYGTETLPAKGQRKSGLLHWFTSAVKKTYQKVAFFSN